MKPLKPLEAPGSAVIAIVDDDPDEVLLAHRLFKKSALKNELLTFNHGEDFLGYLDNAARQPERIPAVVLMDVRMPDMNGFEVVRRMQEIGPFEESPQVIMMSNSNDPADSAQAEQAGVYFQIKPDSCDEYIEFLNSLAPVEA